MTIEKARLELLKDVMCSFEKYPGWSIQQKNNCMAIYLPSRKPPKIRRAKHTEHCSINSCETFSSKWVPAKTCIHHLSVDTGCSPDDVPRKNTDRDVWRERESQGNLCCLHATMIRMIMMMIIGMKITIFLVTIFNSITEDIFQKYLVGRVSWL